VPLIAMRDTESEDEKSEGGRAKEASECCCSFTSPYYYLFFFFGYETAVVSLEIEGNYVIEANAREWERQRKIHTSA